MKHLATLVALLLFAAASNAQAVKDKDLKALEGSTWIGTLTYLDYSSGKKTSIKSNLNVTKRSKDTWNFAYIYPDEPKANGASDVELAADGRTFNGQTILAKRKSDGGIQIVTTKDGQDNDKKAIFRFTYSITLKNFSIRKEVQYVGETKWFKRNTYSWTR